MTAVEPNITTTLITATLGGGGTVALIGLIKSFVDKWSGKADRERAANRETLDDFRRDLKAAEGRVQVAEEKAARAAEKTDYERAQRIHYQEDLSRIIQIAYQHNVPAEAIMRRPFIPKETKND